ncbi:hypothetical protein GCM10027578_09710 [Spirosoma luteolum]
MPFRLLLLCLLLGTQSVLAQTALTAQQAYDYLQNERHRADKIVGDARQPPADSLRRGEQILLDALTYYHRPDIQALAKTNNYLRARKGDISYDLALIQAKLGKTDAAATTLAFPLSGASAQFYAPHVLRDSAFVTVRQTPLVSGLLQKVKAASRVFNSDALKTAYKPVLSEAEKVAGLSKIWSEAKYNFAYFDHVPDLDWDQLYLDYLPKVQAAPTTAAYYHVLESFIAQLHDGHTDIWPTDPRLADSVARRPPLRCVLVGNEVLVQDVLSDSLRQTGIRPGLVLVSIDGLPTKTYADRYVRPYQSGSTPQNIDVSTYTYALLNGPKDRPVTLVFRDGTGKTFSRVLPRFGYGKLSPTPAFRFRVLPGNVAYVQLNNFENSKALDGFVAAFDSIAQTNSLILDVRLNGGGDSGYGWNILGYLTDKPMKTGSYSSRIYSPLRRARGEQVLFESVGEDNTWPANGKKIFTKPVAVLIGSRTFSAAEDFAVMFDAMQRGTLVGEPTGGSTGQPLVFALPGGVMARVCTKRDAYPDGTEWNGKGIQPNLLVRPTVTDVQAGRDPVLDAALAKLSIDVPGKPVRPRPRSSAQK